MKLLEALGNTPDRINNLQHHLLNESSIDWLANNRVLPKYGFPVDVIRMLPERGDFAADDVKLERDLKIGIYEYAPGQQVIADKRVFESYEPVVFQQGLLRSAIEDKSRGMGMYPVQVHSEALEYCATMAEGDARRALGAIELAILSSDCSPIVLDVGLVRESMQKKVLQFDASGDQHYDMASALIKSIRGSDVDASLYWLSRCIESGEEIRFLCRRLVILASEDIGNADPHALPLAVAAMQACEFVGLPECELTLSQATIYLALAPKSNSATLAIGAAKKDVMLGTTIPVPVHLRDGHYAGSERLGHGQGYEYSHESEGGVAQQDYLGVDREYYIPVCRGFESELATRWIEIKAKLKKK
jgi:putative ATPase